MKKLFLFIAILILIASSCATQQGTLFGKPRVVIKPIELDQPPMRFDINKLKREIEDTKKPLTIKELRELAAKAGASNFYGATALTGGAAGALDSIDGTNLATGDAAYTITSTAFYVYYLNATSGAAESSPDVISPDTNAGSKRWLLIFQGDAILGDIASLTPTDSNFIVGNGSTWVAESGVTARTSLGLTIGTDVLAEQTIGIADDNLVEVDDADAADDDYAKFTVNGLEGRSYAEVRADLDLEAGTDFYSLTAEDTWRSGVTQTEMGYVDGVTSDIQTQFDAKAPLASPAITGATTIEDLTFSKTLKTFQGSDVASANNMTLGDGNFFDITGVTTINTIATKGIGTFVVLQFDGILQLTHSADLFLPTAANVTTAAGDIAVFYEYASADWRCIAYTRADGSALSETGGVATDVIWDAAGDLVQGTGANTAARLAMGGSLAIPRVNVGATAIEWGTGGQIVFPATAVPSADPNTLDAYEEGTWTPVVADASSGGNSGSVGTTSAIFTKIGNLVTVSFVLVGIDTTGLTGANDFFIRGLPFAIGGGASQSFNGACRVWDFTFTGYLTITTETTGTYFRFLENASGTTYDFIIVSEVADDSARAYGTLQYMI